MLVTGTQDSSLRAFSKAFKSIYTILKRRRSWTPFWRWKTSKSRRTQYFLYMSICQRSELDIKKIMQYSITHMWYHNRNTNDSASFACHASLGRESGYLIVMEASMKQITNQKWLLRQFLKGKDVTSVWKRSRERKIAGGGTEWYSWNFSNISAAQTKPQYYLAGIE